MVKGFSYIVFAIFSQNSHKVSSQIIFKEEGASVPQSCEKFKDSWKIFKKFESRQNFLGSRRSTVNKEECREPKVDASFR